MNKYIIGIDVIGEKPSQGSMVIFKNGEMHKIYRHPMKGLRLFMYKFYLWKLTTFYDTVFIKEVNN